MKKEKLTAIEWFLKVEDANLSMALWENYNAHHKEEGKDPVTVRYLRQRAKEKYSSFTDALLGGFEWQDAICSPNCVYYQNGRNNYSYNHWDKVYDRALESKIKLSNSSQNGVIGLWI